MARRKISATDKPNRKAELDPANDQFVDKTMSLLDWAYERRRPIIALFGAALIAAIAGIVVHMMLEGAKEDASASLASGLEAATAPIVPPSEGGDSVPAANKDDAVTFETLQARATATLKQFDETIGRNDAATKTFAELGKAAAHYDLGEYDAATAGYEKILGSAEAKLPWVKHTATEGLALSLEASGKADEALKKFESLMGESGPVANAARYHAGRISAEKGDKERAEELLTEVLDSYTESGKASRFDYVFVQAREYLLALNPQADVPEIPGSGLENLDPRLLRQLLQSQGGQS